MSGLAYAEVPGAMVGTHAPGGMASCGQSTQLVECHDASRQAGFGLQDPPTMQAWQPQ
jgi:hypothetical protein